MKEIRDTLETVAWLLIVVGVVFQSITAANIRMEVEAVRSQLSVIESRHSETQAETLVRVRSIEQWVDAHVQAASARSINKPEN